VESKTAPTTFDDLIAFLHPDDRQPVLAAAAELRQDRPYVDMEFRFVRPTGEVRHVLARASVQRDEQGQAFGTLGAVFDITDRKRLEEQLSQRRKMEAIGELTAGIAHNFNNVLSIIMSNLELCIADAPPTTTARLYDIQLAARRAADLVRQLMLFARRDAGGRPRSIARSRSMSSSRPVACRSARIQVSSSKCC
jgi:signal transduction histidine kinase